MRRSEYQRAIVKLMGIRPVDGEKSGYQLWIYKLRRGLIADAYDKTELQVEADIRALFATNRADA